MYVLFTYLFAFLNADKYLRRDLFCSTYWISLSTYTACLATVVYYEPFHLHIRLCLVLFG